MGCSVRWTQGFRGQLLWDGNRVELLGYRGRGQYGVHPIMIWFWCNGWTRDEVWLQLIDIWNWVLCLEKCRLIRGRLGCDRYRCRCVVCLKSISSTCLQLVLKFKFVMQKGSLFNLNINSIFFLPEDCWKAWPFGSLWVFCEDNRIQFHNLNCKTTRICFRKFVRSNVTLKIDIKFTFHLLPSCC